MQNNYDEKNYNMIVAADRHGNIGYKNTIPWHLEGDLARFSRLTKNSILIMGRHTYQSIKGDLPGRIKIVISRELFKNPGETKSDTYFFVSLAQALTFINRDLKNIKNVFFIGGATLYSFALRLGVTLHWTEVLVKPKVGYDTTIPDFEQIIASKYGDSEDRICVTNSEGKLTHCYRTMEILKYIPNKRIKGEELVCHG